jgi:hypothetical protein
LSCLLGWQSPVALLPADGPTGAARRQRDPKAPQRPAGAGRRRPRPAHRPQALVSRQGPGQAKAAERPAKTVEAELLEQVDRGGQRGSRTRTVAALVERWFTWRQQVKPISPVTVANDRGAIDRCILPALGRAKLREVDAAALDALYAQVRAHGGRCRACWTGIRRGEPPLRAGERDRPSVSASEGPSSLVAAPLATHKAGLGCAGLVRWAGDIERICGGSHTSTGESDGRPDG